MKNTTTTKFFNCLISHSFTVRIPPMNKTKTNPVARDHIWSSTLSACDSSKETCGKGT